MRRDILGQRLHLNGEAYTVIGIMPALFRFPNPEWQLWAPLGIAADAAGSAQTVNVVYRLRPGTTPESAGAELSAISRRHESAESAGGEWYIVSSSLHDELNHVRHASPSIFVLTAAAAFVLLIACANIANLLLARATARRKEIAVRRAIGAGQGQIIRQMLVEATLLSLCGGAIGMMISWATIRVLVATCPAWVLPAGGVDLDATVLWFTAALSVLTGVIFGLAPALQASGGALAEAVKEGGRSADASGRHWLRRVLVVSEMSAAVILLIGAGLLIQSLRTTSDELGFRPENLLTMDVSLPRAKYVSDSAAASFYEEVIRNFRRIPGAVSAGAVGRFGRSSVVADGSAVAPGEEVVGALFGVTTDYLSTMGVTLRAGRFFGAPDTENSQPVVIVNESLARRVWPGVDPCGRTLKFGKDGTQWTTVVGVIADARGNPLEVARPEAYVPHLQRPARMMQLVLRSTGNPASLANSARAQVAAVDPHQAVSNVRTMEELMAFQMAPQRVTSGLLTVFAAVALLLAATGIYGVMAYSVSQRTHEIGVRVALGASPRGIVRMVILEAGALAAVGTIVGLAGALGLTRLMHAILYGVSATDPLTFTGVPTLLAAVVVCAAYVPAVRAARVDPLSALRCD
jgi:putative ABC transport system permease protein